jgi:hypothetical protein
MVLKGKDTGIMNGHAYDQDGKFLKVKSLQPEEVKKELEHFVL